jgi:23S rRNA (uridine2552-2'-O)-methyltransferase
VVKLYSSKNRISIIKFFDITTFNNKDENMYEKPDFYSKKAIKEGYVARSIYKLIEIQDKFNLFKKGNKILDLGCAPGSWSQYVSSVIDKNGILIGIDYKEIKVSPTNAIFIKGNFLKDQAKNKIAEYAPFDGIISDMAPDTCGDRLTDCYASSNLVKDALKFSYEYLIKGGFFIAKIFQGGDEKEIMDEIKSTFKIAKWFKPKSSRKKSIELFIIGIDFIKKPEYKNNKDIIDLENSDGTMPW